MKRMVAILSVLAILVCMCACQKTPTSNVPTQPLTTPTDAPTAPTESQAVNPDISSAVKTYFDQREAYLLGTSDTIENINPGILPDEAAHRAAITDSGVERLESKITIVSTGSWDSHAEAIVTEVVSFRVNGVERKETIIHTIQLGQSEDGTMLIVCDDYLENTTDFKSCSYVAPDKQS